MNRACAVGLIVATFSERPDLLGRVFEPEIAPRSRSRAFDDSDRILNGYREYGLWRLTQPSPIGRLPAGKTTVRRINVKLMHSRAVLILSGG